MTLTNMLYDKHIGPFDLKIAAIPLGGNVLDIGFGTGENIINFAKAGFSTYALDNSDELLDNLEKRKRELNLSINIIRADAINTPFKDGVFDLVILTEVLEHIPQYENLVKEINRILKPGGHAIISVPTYYTEKIYTFLNPAYPTNATHVNLFRKKFLKSLFAKHNFNIIKVKNANFRPALFWVFNSALRAKHDYAGRNLSHRGFANFFDNTYNLLNRLHIGYPLEIISRNFFAKSHYYYLRKS